MLLTPRILIAALAGLALMPAGQAAARPVTTTFSATFQAERKVDWDRPRRSGFHDCNGDHWSQANGSERQTISTRPFRVSVTRLAGRATWTFGRGQNVANPDDIGIDAKGPHTRTWEHRSGTTGGWCSGPTTFPTPENDCGTRIPEFKLLFVEGRGEIDWTPRLLTRPRERQGFDRCMLEVPAGMPNAGFPRMQGKVKAGDVFNPRRRTIVVGNSKTYGPDVSPSFGTKRSGSLSWKLTLKRTS